MRRLGVGRAVRFRPDANLAGIAAIAKRRWAPTLAATMTAAQGRRHKSDVEERHE
jgi:hypothetical protein